MGQFKITVNLDQTSKLISFLRLAVIFLKPTIDSNFIADTLIYAKIMTILYNNLEKSSKTMLRDCGYDERLGEFPLQVNKFLVNTQ